MHLPFKYKTSFDDYDKKLEDLKEEKKMLAEEITNIIKDVVEKVGLVTRRERNISSTPSNPCDLAIGDEENFRICGLEIKSDGDTYTRLTSQLDAYLFAFDEVYLVVHKKEVPEWLPREIGVIRVFENKDIIVEKHTWKKNLFDISSNYEWDALFRANNLGVYSKKTRDFIDALEGVRKKIIFNRYFAKFKDWENKKFEKYYPFTDKEKTAILGSDIKYHYKNAAKELKKFEKHIDLLRRMLAMGQGGLKDFE